MDRTNNDKLYSKLTLEIAKLSRGLGSNNINDILAIISQIKFEENMDYYKILKSVKRYPMIIAALLPKFKFNNQKMGAFFEESVNEELTSVVLTIIEFMNTHRCKVYKLLSEDTYIGAPCFHDECYDPKLTSNCHYKCNEWIKGLVLSTIKKNNPELLYVLLSHNYIFDNMSNMKIDHYDPILRFVIGNYSIHHRFDLLAECRKLDFQTIMKMYHINPVPFQSSYFLKNLIKKGPYNLFPHIYFGDKECENLLLEAIDNPEATIIFNYLINLTEKRAATVSAVNAMEAPLPSAPIVSQTATSSSPLQGKCGICYYSMQSTTLPCGHVFHKNCCKDWMNQCETEKKDKTCPFCRAVVN